MKIDWNKYVDQIYCITFTGKRNGEMYDELKRVDILDSGIYFEFENIKTPLYEKLYRSFFGYQYEGQGYMKDYSYAYDVTIAHYYCMKHAEQHGYNRILILENDNVFLKNKSAISTILDIAMEKCDDNGFIFCGAAGHAIYDYENEYHRNTLYQCTKEIDYDIIKLENDINTCGGASFNIYDKKAYTTFTKYIENGNYWTIDVYKNIYNLNEISIYFSNTYIAVQESWFGIFINALYNYNVNPNYKDKYLNICVGDYNSILDHALDHTNDIESDIWAHHIVFDQINEILFNNSLDKSKYINRDNLII